MPLVKMTLGLVELDHDLVQPVLQDPDCAHLARFFVASKLGLRHFVELVLKVFQLELELETVVLCLVKSPDSQVLRDRWRLRPSRRLRKIESCQLSSRDWESPPFCSFAVRFAIASTARFPS